jgi:DHA2 family multidrug resistance protein
MSEQVMKPLRGFPLFIVTFALATAGFMQILDTSIANVSIPYIAGDLAVSNNQGTWVITSFAVGNAIALPLTGWLAGKFGAVRLIALSMLLFALLSWICGATLNFPMLVVSRFFQGVVGGPLIPLGQSLLLQSYPSEKKHFGLSFFFTVIVIAPIAGPILGGWITQDYHWPWIFYINVPIGCIATLIVWKYLRHRETPTNKNPSDWLGLGLLVIGISSLQILLDKGEEWDWFDSPFIQTLGIISAIALTILIVWELTAKHPLIELRLFKNRNFTVGTFITALSYMLFFGAIVITPLWLQAFMGYTALWAGLSIAPMGIFPVILSIAVAKMMNRYPLQNIIIWCFLCMILTFYLFSLFDTDISFEKIALTRLLLGFTISFYFNPLVAISHQDIPVHQLSSATGLFHFFRIFAGGAGTSLFIYLWDRRAILHHHQLAETLTPFTNNTQEVLWTLNSVGIKGDAALGALDVMVTEQAYVLATNDVFRFSMWICIALLFLIFFFERKSSNASSNTISLE